MRESIDVSFLDLFYGAGGRKNAPHPAGFYTFVEEITSGGQAKFDIRDSNGVRWRVKLGKESKAEVAATRLLWAAGYFVDEDYYLEQFKVAGIPTLRRGSTYVSNGVVYGARLERKPESITEVGNWSWFDNPFSGTREFNGLRVMMALMNNWDVKKDNNAIYLADGERHYVVTDVGATFGKTAQSKGTKSNVAHYANSKFIHEVTPTHVSFVLTTRLLFPAAIVVPVYVERARRRNVAKDIPLEDAKWLGQKLAQLSEQQIADCFRSAGYTREEVEAYTKAVQTRISALNALEIYATGGLP
jgi:hypothetical protein